MRKRSLSGKLKTILNSNKLLSYTRGCIKGYSDSSICDFMRGKSIDIFRIHTNSKAYNNEKIVYWIKTGNVFSGFGAQFRRTLEALSFADYYNLNPCIEYTKDFLYAEKDLIEGTSNPFEYYFCQVSNINIVDINNYNFVEFQEEHRNIIKRMGFLNDAYSISEDYISYMAYIINKYIRINDSTHEYIDKSLTKLKLGKKYIAVHVRGTDFNLGYKDHPQLIKIHKYFKVIDELLNHDSKISKIFLATDEESIINEFIGKYRKNLVYYKDVFRSSNGKPVHFSNVNRENHHYRLGLEILRDIITLSKGDFLVACNSQVSYSARMFKKSYGEVYEKIIVLNEGIYK